MEKPQTHQIESATSIESDQNAPLGIEALRRVEKQDSPKVKQQNKAAEYQRDQWESLPFKRKTTVVAIVLFVLVMVSLLSVIEKKTEFLIGSCLAVTVALIALSTYYVVKKQWFSMEEGLKRTDSLIKQNDRMIRAVQKQGRIAKKTFEASIYTSVIVSKGKLQKALSEEPSPIADLDIENTGNGTAHYLRVYADTRCLGEDDFIQFLQQEGVQKLWDTFDEAETLGSGVLGVGQCTESTTKAKEWRERSMIPVYLKQGIGHVFVWGAVFYEDNIGRRYASRFCLYSTDPTDRILSIFRIGNEILVKPPRKQRKKQTTSEKGKEKPN